MLLVDEREEVLRLLRASLPNSSSSSSSLLRFSESRSGGDWCIGVIDLDELWWTGMEGWGVSGVLPEGFVSKSWNLFSVLSSSSSG